MNTTMNSSFNNGNRTRKLPSFRLFNRRRLNSTSTRRRNFINRSNNRLQRAKNAYNYERNYNPQGNYVNNVNKGKKIYVKNLPRYIDNKGLFSIFRKEGRIVNSHIIYDNLGFSTGTGIIEFLDFRDAWKVINNWNNATYKGLTLKVEYQRNTKRNLNKGVNGRFIQQKYQNNQNYGKAFGYQKWNNFQRNKYNNNYQYNNYRYSYY